MKDRPEIVFVFKKADGTIDRMSKQIPLPTLHHDYEVPEGALLHEIMLKGSKRYSAVHISGKVSPKGASERVEVREERWFNTQSVKLQTPLYDEVFIVFEVTEGNQSGEDITNLPNTRRRPAEGIVEKVRKTVGRLQKRPTTPRYEEYIEFTVHLDRK